MTKHEWTSRADKPAKMKEVVAMRLRGASWTSIIETLDLNYRTARSYYAEALAMVPVDDIATARELHRQRLERLLEPLEERIQEGDSRAVQQAINISKELRILDGINAPQQIEVAISEAEQSNSERLRLLKRQGDAERRAIDTGELTEE